MLKGVNEVIGSKCKCIEVTKAQGSTLVSVVTSEMECVST